MAVYEKNIIGLTIMMRDLREDDAEETYKMRTDIEKAKFLHSPPASVDGQREYIRLQRRRVGDYYFAIEDLEGRIIGMKAFYDLDEKIKQITSGRFISFGSQIQNLEAMCLGFDFAFESLGMKSILMSVLEINKRTKSLQQRFGVIEKYRIYNDYFESDEIFSVLSKDNYYSRRGDIMGLVNRFAHRK